MGGKQSVRATHFQHPTPEPEAIEEDSEEHHISISNKMVERLVEDATLAGGAAAEQVVTPKGDYKEKMYIERLKCLDDSHSERTGLTINDLNTLAARIDLRTSNMVSVDPVCADCKEKVIECYNIYKLPEDNIKCWDTVGEFTACVHAASAARLRARTQRDAREHARRSRHVELARQNELRDLGPGIREETTTA